MNWPPFFKIKDARAFFAAVKASLEKSADWRLREHGEECDVQFLSVDYVGIAFEGDELGFGLCLFSDRPEQIQLTMHARRWPSNSTFVSDTEYLAAESMALSVFQGAGRLLNHPLRLSRPRREKHLVGKLADKFMGFCNSATDMWHGGKLNHLHPNDYERFYEFICAAHRSGSALQPDELIAELTKAGFNPELTKELGKHYEIGRRILAIGTWPWHRTDADVWNPWNVREDRKQAKIRKKKRDDEEYRRAFGVDRPHSP
jgi:hypothetical protein